MCHLKMKAQPINIIGDHLLLVTTQSESQRSAIHQTRRRLDECLCKGGCFSTAEPVHPSLTPGMLNVCGGGGVGCMLSPSTCLLLPDHSPLLAIRPLGGKSARVILKNVLINTHTSAHELRCNLPFYFRL